MGRYTLDDLMVMAGIEDGYPRTAVRVGSDYHDEMPYLEDDSIYADEGDEFDLTYDEGRWDETVRVTI